MSNFPRKGHTVKRVLYFTHVKYSLSLGVMCLMHMSIKNRYRYSQHYKAGIGIHLSSFRKKILHIFQFSKKNITMSQKISKHLNPIIYSTFKGPCQKSSICNYRSLFHNLLTPPPPLVMEHQMLK
jgi:hypothetical protein